MHEKRFTNSLLYHKHSHSQINLTLAVDHPIAVRVIRALSTVLSQTCTKLPCQSLYKLSRKAFSYVQERKAVKRMYMHSE